MLHRIVLVDDAESDALLVKRRLKQAGMDDPVFWINDARKLMAYVNGEGPYADRSKFPLPEVILLDLKMPDIDGYQVLKWLRADAALTRIVIIVLTSETNPRLIQLAYQLGANSFVQKDARIEEYRHLVDFLRTFAPLANALPRETSRSAEDAAGNEEVA